MSKEIYPEAFYKKNNLEGVDLIPYETEVAGVAIKFDSKRREVIVDLGYGWTGIIPEVDVSIYDFTYSETGDIPHQVLSIIGKTVNAVVIDEVEKNTLLLSRRQSMIRGWNMLEEGTIIDACITNNIGYGIFLDLGNGLVGYNHRKELSAVRISDTRLWYKVGNFIKVKLLSKGETAKSQLICSHKLAYPSTDENIKSGDIVAVRIGMNQVEKGYLCQVTPRIPGIIDTELKLYEGQLTRGLVKKITEKGVKLNFIG